MIKKGVSYGGGLSTESIFVHKPITMELKTIMTAIIQVKNENGAVICSDTWNHGNKNHYIQKIFYNKENKVMIAQAGDNGVYLENNSLWLISNIFQDFCDNFNSRKSDVCINELNEILSKFIYKITLNGNKRQSLVQYILVYFDENCNIETLFYENCRTKNGNYILSEEIIMNKQEMIKSELNEYCLYIGNEIINKNSEFKNITFSGQTLLCIKNIAIDYIKNEIQKENHLSDEERFIGGNIHYVTMDNKGNIETNIS